jgi:aldehyde dehydrogenase (NAD+)
MDFKSNINYRKVILEKLLRNIINHENEIIDALYKDFKKPVLESVLTETNYVISELKATIKNLDKWVKPKKVLPTLLNFPSSDYIFSEPYGNVLIISPWNYPFQLALCPLIAAVAAGNKVTLKPSELTPNTSFLIAKIIRETFDVKHVVAILGDAKIAENLLNKRWDFIFFTGSVKVGKIVAKAAAEHLTPIVLELGGKNPCIVEKSANLKLSAKRIVWGKFLNAGQTCIAPDYLLVHKSIKQEFIAFLKQEITNFYSENPKLSPDFARIINKDNWNRQIELIENQNVIFGGISKEDDLYLSPTLIYEPSLSSKLMQDEIFGPILPIISFENEEELKTIILKYEKPLALYVFSENTDFSNRIIKEYSFGGGCINDTIVHFSNNRLPFGGVGNSGNGAYHGKLSFDVFSHQKAIVKKATWLDIPLRYAPYKSKTKMIRKLLKWF